MSQKISPSLFKGAKVFPCIAWEDDDTKLLPHQRGKRPLTPNGFKDASADPVVIQGWIDRYPNCNWATPANEEGNCFVDIDGPEGEAAWFALQCEYGFVETREKKTPRGRHLQFRGRLLCTTGNVAEHVDTRGNGGYVLIYPSVVDGVQYGEFTDSRIADLPDWVVQKATKKAEKPQTPSACGGIVEEQHARTLLSFVDPNNSYEPWRNVVAAVRSLDMVDDPDLRIRRRLAHEWSKGSLDRDRRGQPARYSGPEAVDKVFDTMPPRPGGVGYGTLFHAAREGGYDGLPARQSGAETFRDFIQNQATQEVSPVPFLMNESDIFALPDPEELILGFLMKGENVCFYGPPKVGKTFIALDIALSLAADLPVFGHVPTKTTGAVVYLSGEGHAGMKRRIKAWRKARQIAPDRRLSFYYKAGVPMTKAGMAEAKRYVDGILNYLGENPVLVVIDTMARSMAGLDENSSGDAGQYLGLTETLRTGLSCTMLTLAHSGKKLDHGLRGSTAFVAGFDAVWFAEMYAVRLDRLRDLEECWSLLAPLDHQGLLGKSDTAPRGFAEPVSDDELLAELQGAAGASDITALRHVRTSADKRAAEEIANRTTCEDFETFKPLFIHVKRDLDLGVRQTRPFQTMAEIKKGEFFIVGGQIAYVADVGNEFMTEYERRDSRLRVIYDNGTESDVLLRSLQRALHRDEAGRRITEPSAGPLFSGESDDGDLASGTIYVLRSKSDDSYVAAHRDVLHKIGVTGGDVKQRIANAKLDPTYLMADVDVVATYELFNINRVRLEKLIHRIFDSARVNVEIKDRFGNPIVPREWFLVPRFVIDEAVERIKNGTITDYVYDPQKASLSPARALKKS